MHGCARCGPAPVASGGPPVMGLSAIVIVLRFVMLFLLLR